MGAIVEEVHIWNSPSVGAFLLWRFTQGYIDNHDEAEPPLGLLHFIAAAILTSPSLCETISNQRANLQSYVRGFEDKKLFDQLLSIHERTSQKRVFTLESLDLATSQGLLLINPDTGKVHCKNIDKKPRKGNAVKPSMKRLGEKAEILGNWFAEHDVFTTARYLKVVF